jgi:hypothetical protein
LRDGIIDVVNRRCHHRPDATAVNGAVHRKITAINNAAQRFEKRFRFGC